MGHWCICILIWEKEESEEVEKQFPFKQRLRMFTFHWLELSHMAIMAARDLGNAISIYVGGYLFSKSVITKQRKRDFRWPLVVATVLLSCAMLSDSFV